MVTLTAAFGDNVDLGTVEGAVDGFMVDGEEMPWSVALRPAAIHTDGAMEADSINTAKFQTWSVQEPHPHDDSARSL